MAIFSRRTLQHIIDENSSFMSHSQLKSRVDMLNRYFNISSVATEWELVVLNAFSKLGNVSYEKKLGGVSEIDVYFQLGKAPEVSFIADITAVSDEGYNQNNPIEVFQKELYKKIRTCGLRPNNFSLKVEAKKVGKHGKQKVLLNLPKDNEEIEDANRQIQQFVSYIIQNNLSKCQTRVKTQNCDILLMYDINQPFAGCMHPAYNVVYDPHANPIYNTLKAKKRQLGNTNFDGPKGIILCDGGCYSLRDSKGITQKIINDFLRQNTSINFVSVIIVKRKQASGHLGKAYLDSTTYYNPNTKISLSKELREIIEQLLAQFPEPVSDVVNALNHLKSKYKKQGLSEYGRLVVERDGSVIKIPARALLQLLSEKISLEKFLKDHHLGQEQKDSFSCNVFKKNLDAGKTIKNIYIEPTDSEDELIVFEFRRSDPAITQFAIPSQAANKK